MNKAPVNCLLLACLSLIACEQHSDKKDYVITEKDLIPEGVAFDNRTGTIYIGSTFKRKIVQISADGSITDFIPEKLNGITSLVGMEVDEERGVLWANTAYHYEVPLLDPDTTMDWKTSICSFDIKSKKLQKEFLLHEENAFLNDLTVLPNGDVFATETVNAKLYRIGANSDSLELFLAPGGFKFLNGITYSDKLNCLFVSAEEGVLKIDLNTKTYFLIKTPDGVDAGGIDGLALYKDRLIGHQSKKVVVFYLNDKGTEIVKSSILDTGKEFDSSTTGEIGGNHYYFIVNSQIRSGMDHENKKIKPMDSLENVIIRRIGL